MSNKKLLKHSVAVSKNNKSKNKHSSYNFEVVDFEPKEIYLPKKYYTAAINNSELVQYFNKGDILIIDPSIRNVRESGIYLFEHKGLIFIRQFAIMPVGYKNIKNKKVYYSVGCICNDYFAFDEINVLGAVISKQVEIFHNLYYGENTAHAVYGSN